VRLLLLANALSVLWHGPHWLSYFNEFVGGPKRGGEWLLVSNLDWGQDLYYLKQWRAKHPECEPLELQLYSGFDTDIIGLKENLDPIELQSREGSRFVAVSVNCLRGHQFGDSKISLELAKTELYDWCGYSICIFRLDAVPFETVPASDKGIE
jgi:hypothetical protein